MCYICKLCICLLIGVQVTYFIITLMLNRKLSTRQYEYICYTCIYTHLFYIMSEHKAKTKHIYTHLFYIMSEHKTKTKHHQRLISTINCSYNYEQ